MSVLMSIPTNRLRLFGIWFLVLSFFPTSIHGNNNEDNTNNIYDKNYYNDNNDNNNDKIKIEPEQHGNLRHLLSLGKPPSGSTTATTTTTTIDLPFGDINLLVVTDVHSWIAGHGRHEPRSNADYGDVISLYERLSKVVDNLYLVMNGDFMDGTGLSTIPPKHLTPLLERMPFDVINLGNHELYFDETVEWIQQKFVPHWNGNYLTSNSLMASTKKPIGNRYTYLTAKVPSSSSQGNGSSFMQSTSTTTAKVLVFGFLYNFENHCNSTTVEHVQDVVEQEWFQTVLLKLDYEAILVMAHMHVTDPLIDVILQAIRSILPREYGDTMPVQFITGHTHIRAYSVIDEYSASMEAGRFLDTIGFCSFPLRRTILSMLKKKGLSSSLSSSSSSPAGKNNDRDVAGISSSISSTTTTTKTYSTTATTTVIPTEDIFPHVFLNTNRQSLSQLLHVDSISTRTGIAMADKIHQTQDSLGLFRTVGCAPRSYDLWAAMDRPESLWGLYMHKIVPTILFSITTTTGNDDENSIDPLPNDNDNDADTTTVDGGGSDTITSSSVATKVFAQGTGAFRYDMFHGNLNVDDIIAVCPFNDTIYQVTTNLTGKQLLQVLGISSTEPNTVIPYGSKLPEMAISVSRIYKDRLYDLLTVDFHLAFFVQRVEQVLAKPIPDPQPVVRSTTTFSTDNKAANSRTTTTTTGLAATGSTPLFWTTTGLWMAFVENEWPCPEKISSISSGSSSSSVLTKSFSTPNKATTTTTTTTPTTNDAAAAAIPATAGTINSNNIDEGSGGGGDMMVDVTVKEEKPLAATIFTVSIIFGVWLHQQRQRKLRQLGYAPIVGNDSLSQRMPSYNDFSDYSH